MTGRVHSIQTLGAADGPGIRTVIFLQGCPLRCAYCHNPDTWPPNGGREKDAIKIMRRVLRARPFYGEHGGVTISGGEPLMQAAFAAELFTLCKAEGIHTALDTSGCLWNADVMRLLDVTDLCLLDVKMADEAGFHQLTGGGLLADTMRFLHELNERKIATWVRQVIVPGINDTTQQARALKALVAPYACVEKIELLPFQKMCVEKYRRMGLVFPLQDVEEPSDAVMEALRAVVG